MKLKIGDCEIPEHCLRYVILYPESSSVAFAGVLVGEERLQMKAELRRLAQMKATPYEAVDRHGVGSSGLCDIKNLKFGSDSTPVITFSGQLIRPFRD